MAWCRMAAVIVVLSLTPYSLLATFDCSFKSSYPRQYVAYKTDHNLVMDGKLDEFIEAYLKQNVSKN